MADRTFFKDVFEQNGSADARHNYSDGTDNRVFMCHRDYLFFHRGFNRFDILRLDPRRSINRRAFFRTARRQRLRGRGGFNSVFYFADYFDVSDESVFESLMKNENLILTAKCPKQAKEIGELMANAIGKK